MHDSIKIIKSTLAIALWITSFSLQVHSEGVFQLRLKHFSNNKSLDATGGCCVSSIHDPEHCRGPCRTAFRVCLKHFQARVEPGPPCYYGKLETPVIGKDTFSPMDHRFFGNNPIQFKFNFSWPGYFSLIVDAIHKKNNETERQKANVDSTHVLISRLVKSGYQLPGKNKFSLWSTPKPYRHRNSELEYEYRVLCLKNTYGSECSTYCRPRNDRLGHYSCNKNGQKICLPGWTSSNKDTYCTKAATCQEGCFHGTCALPNSCKCNLGWTGKDCSRCVTRTGCEHGTCSGPFQCKCQVGWGGHYCNQDLNFCTNNSPCQNGALCSNTGQGSYTCECPPGFVGRNCHLKVDECFNQSCRNSQICENLTDDDQCMCSKFLGRLCSESVQIKCSDLLCQHGGSCVEGNNFSRCQCPADWAGITCEAPAHRCSNVICKNGGSCGTLLNSFKCYCKSGFSGTFCENVSKQCFEHLCFNGGVCLDPPNAHPTCHCRRCRCTLPYSGKRCQYDSVSLTTKVPIGRSASSEKDPHILAKYEHKETYFIKDNAETKIIIVDNQSQSLNKTNWIAICFSSGILFLSLLLATGCLIHHRKKMSLSKQMTNLKQHRSTETQDPNKVDGSSVRSRSLQVMETSKDSRLPNRNWPVVSPKIKRFLKRKSSVEGSAWNANDQTNYSEIQLSRKNSSLVDNQPAKNGSSRYSTPVLVFNSRAEHIRVSSTTGDNDESLEQNATLLQETFSEVKPFVEHPNAQDSASLTRPPTYEEVCEENNVLSV